MKASLATLVTIICVVSVGAQTGTPATPPTPAAPAQDPLQAQSGIVSVTDARSFRQLRDTAKDAIVAFSKQDVLAPEIQTALQSVVTKNPALSVLHVVCKNTTKRLCKHMAMDPLTDTLVAELVLVHYRSGRFNRVIKHKDEQSLLTLVASPFANPCDEDTQTSGYTCVNSLQGFVDTLKGTTGKLVTLFYATWNKQVEDIKAQFSALALANAAKAKFVAIDVTLPQTGAIAQALDIAMLPAIAAIDAPVTTTCNVHFFPGNATIATELAAWMLNTATGTSFKCEAANLLGIATTTATVLSTVAPSITVVDETTYETFINQTTAPLLLFIHSSSCRGCGALLAELQRAKTLAQAEALNAEFLILDADNSLELIRRWKITSYPTLEYILNSTFEFIIRSELMKTAEEMVAFFRLPELDRRPFRKLWVKPYVFSNDLKRLTAAEAATQITTTEHAFVMPVYNATLGLDQEIQLRKAVKELSHAIDQLFAGNSTSSAAVSFILINCTESTADAMCAPIATKTTTAAFHFNYYQNGQLTQQATAEELIELAALDAAAKVRRKKVKGKEILRWASTSTGLPLSDELTDHKHKESLEKKRTKKEKDEAKAAKKGGKTEL